MSALLMDERFVAVFPSLVRVLGGLADAAVLQEVHYQLQIGGKERDGHRWVPATARDLSEAIGLSEDQIHRTANRLREKGVLVASNPEAFQRRTWWRVDYDALDHLAESRNGNRENATSQTANARNPNRETATSTTSKKSSKELKQVIIAPNGAQVVQEFVDRYRAAYGKEPSKQVIGRIGRDAKRLLTDGTPLEDVLAGVAACIEAGHANLGAGIMKAAHKIKRSEPRGFDGIREFLDEVG